VFRQFLQRLKKIVQVHFVMPLCMSTLCVFFYINVFHRLWKLLDGINVTFNQD